MITDSNNKMKFWKCPGIVITLGNIVTKTDAIPPKYNTLILLSLSTSRLTDSAGTLNQWGKPFPYAVFKRMNFCIGLQFPEINQSCFSHYEREGKGLNKLIKLWLLSVARQDGQVLKRCWNTSLSAIRPNYI